MIVQELLDILIKLQEEFYNNVLVITYNQREYIVSKHNQFEVKNFGVSIEAELLVSDPTPLNVGEVIVRLNELKPDIEVTFFSKYASRYFNSHEISDLEFSVRRM